MDAIQRFSLYPLKKKKNSEKTKTIHFLAKENEELLS